MVAPVRQTGFLEDLRQQFAHYNDFFINSVYAGMVYEIYFNASGEFRGNELKANLINEIFTCDNLDRLNPAKEFIKSKLKEFEQSLLYFPFETQTIVLDPTLATEPLIEDTVFGEKRVIELIDLKADGISLLTDNPEEQRKEVYFYDTDLVGTIMLVTTIYAVPFKYIGLNRVISIESGIPLSLNNKKFRKLYKDS